MCATENVVQDAAIPVSATPQQRVPSADEVSLYRYHDILMTVALKFQVGSV
jgi:hypothetical protein